MLHLWIRAEVSQPREASGGATLTVRGFAISESLQTSEHKLAQLSNAGEGVEIPASNVNITS